MRSFDRKERLSADDLDAIEEYAYELARLLRLEEWQFAVLDEPTDESASASIRAIQGAHAAEIKVCWGFKANHPDQQRADITHELVHLHLANAEHVIRYDLARHSALNDHEYDFIFATFMRQLEYGVEGLARALAPHMPHIIWPGSKKPVSEPPGPSKHEPSKSKPSNRRARK